MNHHERRNVICYAIVRSPPPIPIYFDFTYTRLLRTMQARREISSKLPTEMMDTIVSYVNPEWIWFSLY